MKSPRGADRQAVNMYIQARTISYVDWLAKKFSDGNRAHFALTTIDGYKNLFSLPPVLRDRLEKAAQKAGETLDDYVRDVLARHAIELPDRPLKIPPFDNATQVKVYLPPKRYEELEKLAEKDHAGNLSATMVDILEQVIFFYKQPPILANRLLAAAVAANYPPAQYIQNHLTMHALELLSTK